MIKGKYLVSLIFASFVLFTSNIYSQTLDQIKALQQKTDQATAQESAPVNLGLSAAEKARLAMTTEDYMVTAGDVYNLSFLAGNAPVSFNITVDSSYKIRVANLAVLNVANTSFINLKRQVEELVTKNYPMSGVQFNLITPGSFKIVVNGEVKETTEVETWSLERLSSIVNEFKTDFSSIRNVKVTSKNGKVHTYDLFKAKRFGDFSQDPYVHSGDVITIGRIDRRVQIKGAVERPGTYEILPGENLKELIEIYGHGLTPMADTSRIELTRKINTASKTGEKFYFNSLEAELPLECYDIVTIGTYNDLKPIMFIEGAIGLESAETVLKGSEKKSVRFEEGLNYASLAREHESIFTTKSDLEHAYIKRGEERISIDLKKALYDNTYYTELTVEPYDTLVIPFKQLYVTVAGAVAMPGRYPYIPDRTYDYYIGLAGGFIEEKNSGDAVKIIDVEGNKLGKTDIIPPETTITAKANSFTYYFNQYAPIITTILGLVTTSVSLGFMFTNK